MKKLGLEKISIDLVVDCDLNVIKIASKSRNVLPQNEVISFNDFSAFLFDKVTFR